MRVLCLGAGGIGGYFGGRLAEAGFDVTFLVRPERQEQLKGRLRIESCYGNADIEVKTATRDTAEGAFDFIFLTCKAYDLPDAIETIAPFVGANGAVLPLLNGVAHIEQLNQRFGKEHVLGGVAKIAVMALSDGTIKHLNDWRFVTFGEQDGCLSNRVETLKAAFDKTSVVAKAVPNIMQVMWEKIVHLATVAGATCSLRASVGEIAQTQYGSALMIELLEQNAEISRKEGYPVSEDFLGEYRRLFRDTSSSYTASMLRDIQRGGPIEADHVIGFMLRKAEQHGIGTRVYRFIYTHLQAYEVHRAAEMCRVEAASAA
jgi:2-dehydropantoate 2-reductase